METFECPICRYEGTFAHVNDPTGKRENALCPSCSALERHRILCLTLDRLSQRHDFAQFDLLHFAPERQLEKLLRSRFRSYTTADLRARGVDFRVDLLELPFPDASYDVVIACHVLEHIREDIEAIKGVKRILRPGGFAILQVPILGTTTVEYPEPNPQEWNHVRAPGENYFARYQTQFREVVLFRSSDFDSRFQPYVFENRTRWPKAYPLRPRSKGHRHEDFVPVCYV